MADHGVDRISTRHRAQQARQRCVLGRLEALALEPLELDADRVVIAAFTADPGGSAGMPGALIARHELQHATIAADEEMCRYAQAAKALEVAMLARVEAVT